MPYIAALMSNNLPNITKRKREGKKRENERKRGTLDIKTKSYM